MMNMPSMAYQNFNMPPINTSQNMAPQNQFVNMQQMNQQQPMMQRQYHHIDYNLNQNIEYRFYEKFDNDIYDEVNRIQQGLDVTKEERVYVLAKL